MGDFASKADALDAHAKQYLRWLRWAWLTGALSIASPLIFGLLALNDVGYSVSAFLFVLTFGGIAVLVGLARRAEAEAIRIRAFELGEDGESDICES
jgi:hypothetical protein